MLIFQKIRSLYAYKVNAYKKKSVSHVHDVKGFYTTRVGNGKKKLPMVRLLSSNSYLCHQGKYDGKWENILRIFLDLRAFIEGRSPEIKAQKSRKIQNMFDFPGILPPNASK